MPPDNQPPQRIESLDQFRGYTVAGMFLVNFIGAYAATPALLKHHNTYCSYADTIMPQFLFAVGFAYRLTMLRRLAAGDGRSAFLVALKRNLGLILLGFVIYHLDVATRAWAELSALGVGGFLKNAFQRTLFQALVHIGVTSLWVMPVIARGAGVRIAFAIASAAAFHLLSQAGYYDFAMGRPVIDGGPLGFLTWTIPLIAGSLAHDAMMAAPDRKPITPLLKWGAALMLLGYVLACLNLQAPPADVTIGPKLAEGAVVSGVLVEPPFVPPTRPINIWTMSQRAGSVSYLVFGAGFSLVVFAAFVWACDPRGWRLAVFTTFGTNALAGYIIHDLVAGAIKPWTPRDAPGWFVFLALSLFMLLCWLFVRALEKNRIYLRM
jgi:predicted acyltransferase